MTSSRHFATHSFSFLPRRRRCPRWNRRLAIFSPVEKVDRPEFASQRIILRSSGIAIWPLSFMLTLRQALQKGEAPNNLVLIGLGGDFPFCLSCSDFHLRPTWAPPHGTDQRVYR